MLPHSGFEGEDSVLPHSGFEGGVERVELPSCLHALKRDMLVKPTPTHLGVWDIGKISPVAVGCDVTPLQGHGRLRSAGHWVRLVNVAVLQHDSRQRVRWNQSTVAARSRNKATRHGHGQSPLLVRTFDEINCMRRVDVGTTMAVQ